MTVLNPVANNFSCKTCDKLKRSGFLRKSILKSSVCKNAVPQIQTGSLRNHDGYGDENVTSKYDYSIVFILFNMGEVS